MESPGVEPLTERELEVLALLRERLSNKEIARVLCLSPMTVKRYTVNRYGRLGVNKRWDAVVEAEALGISSSLIAHPFITHLSPFGAIIPDAFSIHSQHESLAVSKLFRVRSPGDVPNCRAGPRSGWMI